MNGSPNGQWWSEWLNPHQNFPKATFLLHSWDIFSFPTQFSTDFYRTGGWDREQNCCRITLVHLTYFSICKLGNGPQTLFRGQLSTFERVYTRSCNLRTLTSPAIFQIIHILRHVAMYYLNFLKSNGSFQQHGFPLIWRRIFRFNLCFIVISFLWYRYVQILCFSKENDDFGRLLAS